MTREKKKQQIIKELACQKYAANKVSLSEAAEIAGFSVWDMMDLLAQKGMGSRIPYEDLKENLHTKLALF